MLAKIIFHLQQNFLDSCIQLMTIGTQNLKESRCIGFSAELELSFLLIEHLYTCLFHLPDISVIVVLQSKVERLQKNVWSAWRSS
jgi:hypothetical protein